MDAVDFRSIGRAAQEALRRRASPRRAARHEPGRGGQSGRRAAADGQHLAEALAEQGAAGLLDGRRVFGRKGQGALTAEEARQIRRWIADKSRTS